MPYSSVSEAEEKNSGLAKYSDKAKRGWLSSFNKCMEDGDESKCFAIAYSVANKVDGKKASEGVESFSEIVDREDPNATNHDLHLICVECGTEQTCRCSKPKRDFYGLCNKCADPEAWARQELEFAEQMAEFCRTNDSSVLSKTASENTIAEDENGDTPHNDKYTNNTPCMCCAEELKKIARELMEPKQRVAESKGTIEVSRGYILLRKMLPVKKVRLIEAASNSIMEYFTKDVTDVIREISNQNAFSATISEVEPEIGGFSQGVYVECTIIIERSNIDTWSIAEALKKKGYRIK